MCFSSWTRGDLKNVEAMPSSRQVAVCVGVLSTQCDNRGNLDRVAAARVGVGGRFRVFCELADPRRAAPGGVNDRANFSCLCSRASCVCQTFLGECGVGRQRVAAAATVGPIHHAVAGPRRPCVDVGRAAEAQRCRGSMPGAAISESGAQPGSAFPPPGSRARIWRPYRGERIGSHWLEPLLLNPLLLRRHGSRGRTVALHAKMLFGEFAPEIACQHYSTVAAALPRSTVLGSRRGNTT